jgi:hypothetical protein
MSVLPDVTAAQTAAEVERVLADLTDQAKVGPTITAKVWGQHTLVADLTRIIPDARPRVVADLRPDVEYIAYQAAAEAAGVVCACAIPADPGTATFNRDHQWVECGACRMPLATWARPALEVAR